MRFIEYMPFDGNQWNSKKFLPYQEVLKTIREKWPQVQKSSDERNDTTKVSFAHVFCDEDRTLQLTLCSWYTKVLSLRIKCRFSFVSL